MASASFNPSHTEMFHEHGVYIVKLFTSRETPAEYHRQLHVSEGQI